MLPTRDTKPPETKQPSARKGFERFLPTLASGEWKSGGPRLVFQEGLRDVGATVHPVEATKSNVGSSKQQHGKTASNSTAG